MASPIYFFPNVRLTSIVDRGRLRVSFLDGRGCAAAFAGIVRAEDELSLFELTGRGPGGASGTLAQVMPRDGSSPLRVGYFPDFQTWHERPAGADCWVGLDKDQPPMPEELARAPHPQGYSVVMGDGQTWKVPVVRSEVKPTRSSLRHNYGYDADGQAVMKRDPSGNRLWELSGMAFDHLTDREGHPTLPLQHMIELTVGALGLNYRVGKIEQELLGLVNSENWTAAIEAICDIALLVEYLEREKKT